MLALYIPNVSPNRDLRFSQINIGPYVSSVTPAQAQARARARTMTITTIMTIAMLVVTPAQARAIASILAQPES